MRSSYPIIVIGSPRSGTTLVARLLESLGLFMGDDLLSGVHESGMFNRLNGWIVRESGGTIYRPQPVCDLLAHPEARDLALGFLRDRIASDEARSYLGPHHWASARSLMDLDIPWGWKDPRTTFTLPLWLELFPLAKVVHVFRHGVDVASSQMGFFGVTDLAQMVRNYEARWRRRSKISRAFRKLLRLPSKLASEQRLCSSYPEGAFEIWEAYIEEAARHVTRLGDRGHALRYEDLTASPERVLQDLVEFCGLTDAAEEVSQVAGLVRTGRTYAFYSDPALRKFAETASDRLVRHGYSPMNGRSYPIARSAAGS